MLGSLVMGAVVGWIAGELMDTEGGLIRNIIIGLVGSFVGKMIFSLAGFYASGLIANIIVGVAGACVFIWLARKVSP